MPIELSIEVPDAPEDLKPLMDAVLTACAALEGIPEADAAARLVDDDAIRAINRDFRGIDEATDVLSFPSIGYPRGVTARGWLKRLSREKNPETGRAYLGDILLSLPRARAQAQAYGHSLSRELAYLTAHSLFHLMGYDHEDEPGRRAMRRLEERAMARVGLRREEDDMTDQQLFERACEALKRAYAPYSNFRVGACLLSEDGRTFEGLNIENASYGASICAERAAIVNAVCQGVRHFTAIAIVGEQEDAWPCGICRQVLHEFAPDIRIICGNTRSGTFTVEPLKALLPRAFGPNDLARS